VHARGGYPAQLLHFFTEKVGLQPCVPPQHAGEEAELHCHARQHQLGSRKSMTSSNSLPVENDQPTRSHNRRCW